MEQGEQPTTRGYEDLNAPEKVRAILGAVMEPVSKSQVVEFSGLDYEELEDEEKAEVDAIFQSEEVDRSGEEGREKYVLGTKARQALGTTVDMKTVHGRISDAIIAKMGIKL
jgi:hypothetical protein